MSFELNELPEDNMLTLEIDLPYPHEGKATLSVPLDATYDDALRMLAEKYNFRAEDHYLWSVPPLVMSSRILPPGVSRDEWKQRPLTVRSRRTGGLFDDLVAPRRPSVLYGCPTAVHPQADRLAACRVEAIEL